MIKIAIVSPCYNEEEILGQSISRLTMLLNSLATKKIITLDSYILLVNDGSKDSTWRIITSEHNNNKYVKAINLAHNVGHQNAIMAGMMTVRGHCDAVITIDADLQDDINAIEKMIEAFEAGYDVVYGVKVSRNADPLMKRFTAQAFYKLQNKMGVDCVYNHADFRLLSNRVLDALSLYGERNLYLRGIIPIIGFPSTQVDDVISEREGGKSSYTLGKMLALALDGITSFSVKPIYGITYLGIAFLIVSLFIGIYVFYTFFVGLAVPGWASLMLSVWFIGGMVLLSLGVIGMYIGKIFKEVKARPRYHIEEKLV